MRWYWLSYKDYINSIKNETDNDVTLNDDKYVGENPVNDWDVNVDAEKLTIVIVIKIIVYLLEMLLVVLIILNIS